jgi:hypothetical protein
MKRLMFVTVACMCVGPPTFASQMVQYTLVYGQSVDILTPWYSGPMSAGIYKLLIDGVPADSFCIDPPDAPPSFPEPYDIVTLADAPDAVVGPMCAEKAEVVCKLWAMAYDPGMTVDQAVALQIAIWDTVVDLDYNVHGGDFQISGYDYGAQTLLAYASIYTGPMANLVGLSSTVYQDFVTQVVPVSGALWLGCIGLGIVARQRFRKRLRK